MRRSEHLHTSDIAAFRKGLLSEHEGQVTASHLLRCSECRGLLPPPQPKEFWGCLLGEPDHEVRPERFSFLSLRRFFGMGDFNISTVKSVAFASVLFLAVAGLTVLFLFSRFSSTDDNMVAVVSDKETANVKILTSVEEPRPDQTSNGGDQMPVSIDPDEDSTSKSSTSNGVLFARKENRKAPARRLLYENKLPTRAETRGSSTPCGRRFSVGLEATAVGSGIRLSWDKVAGAVSYTVYISDLDERLIDQYDTTDQTSYAVAGVLDRDTTYKWKLIVTLKNGKTIVGVSQNFRIRDLGDGESRQGNLPKRKKTSASVRCAENK